MFHINYQHETLIASWLSWNLACSSKMMLSLMMVPSSPTAARSGPAESGLDLYVSCCCAFGPLCSSLQSNVLLRALLLW